MIDRIKDFWAVRGVSRMSADELRQLQERKLRRIVRHAYEQVPFYRERFRSAGIQPQDIRTLKDLQHIPVTTKRDLQIAGPEQTLAEGADPKSCTILHTSGSTGTPLVIYVGRWERRIRSLVEMRTLRRIGFSVHDRLASVGPHHARKPGLLTRLGIYQTQIIPGMLPAERQLERLRQFQPTVFWSYPTTMRAIYHTTGYRLRDFIRPRVMITSAEVLDELLRAQVREDLGLDPYNFYGCLEIGRIAAECPAREGLHVNVDHVILETWRGDRPAADGEDGLTLVTGLNARTMPFLRYEIGDRIVRLAQRCSCGSTLPLIGPPWGRADDLMVLPSGRRLPALRCTLVLRHHLSILRFRIIQEKVDQLTVLLVTRNPWEQGMIDELRRELLEQLGERLTIHIQCVDTIPDEKEKFRAFISLLPPQMIDHNRGPQLGKDIVQ